MLRTRLAVTSLAVALAACSGKRQSAPPPPPVTPANADAPAAPVDPREAALSGAIRQLLEERHVLQRTIDDKVSEAALAEFVKRIDSGKMFFLAADVEAMNRHAES